MDLLANNLIQTNGTPSIDSLTLSLKAVLLDNEYKYCSVPAAHEVKRRNRRNNPHSRKTDHT